MADTEKLPRERFSPLFIASIRALWESGRFASVEDFVKYGSETYRKFPSLSFINKKIREDGWDKNRTSEENEERAHASFEDLFSKHGMTREDVVIRVRDGINAPKYIIKTIVDLVKHGGGTIDDQTLQKLSSALDYNLRTSKEFIEEYNKMTGGYAATKHRLTGRMNVVEDKKATLEEAILEHERIHSNLVAHGFCKNVKG